VKNGETVGRVWSFRDITERKTAEHRLELSRRVFDVSTQGIMVTDGELHVLDANRALNDLLNLREEELLGTSLAELSRKPQCATFNDLFITKLMNDGEWWGELRTGQNNDAENRTVWINFSAVYNHDDEVTHLPPGGILLASNDHSQVQSVAVTHEGGQFWGLQYHPEYDLHELARLCYCRKQKLTDKGFFQDLDAAQDYVDKLEALHQDPARKDLAWLLGIDEDVMNADVRVIEVRNWIEQLVLPSMRH